MFLAYPIPGRDGDKYRVTGRPVPLAHRGVSQEEGRRRFGLPADRPVLAFFGALAGARSLNELRGRDVRRLGPGRAARVRRARLRAAARRRSNATTTCSSPRRTSSGRLSRPPTWRSRAAGGSVWELAAAGTPAILVPYPFATADHQTKNARYFERGGGAIVVPEPELDRVPALVDELLADPARLAAMRDAMHSMARPHAAEEIAEELIALAASGR